ncbi:uncharacterized protein N7459_005905 [Penicillium hispanicum]|uniref:uncharacterized protein n=1 Tax=Penicillium hispanicum TaxID=1080232 RepID=UPI00253FDE10|nr:uncharacterized protein N7459_005905 [Penicillium hispanicum]KAJ5579920.1 hypothetical protein N7459_005905 [Penicillium hispanicum]
MHSFELGFGNSLGYLIHRVLLQWQDSRDQTRELAVEKEISTNLKDRLKGINITTKGRKKKQTLLDQRSFHATGQDSCLQQQILLLDHFEDMRVRLQTTIEEMERAAWFDGCQSSLDLLRDERDRIARALQSNKQQFHFHGDQLSCIEAELDSLSEKTDFQQKKSKLILID